MEYSLEAGSEIVFPVPNSIATFKIVLKFGGSTTRPETFVRDCIFLKLQNRREATANRDDGVPSVCSFSHLFDIDFLAIERTGRRVDQFQKNTSQMHALYVRPEIGEKLEVKAVDALLVQLLIIIPAPLSHSLRRSTLPKKTGKETRRPYVRDSTEGC